MIYPFFRNYYIKRQELRASYLKRMLAVDGLICPTLGIPSIMHHRSGDAIPAVLYTILFNVLDYSAGVIPVTKVTSADKVADGFKAENDIEKGVYATWDPEVYKDCPVSVQVVGKRLEEEKVLAMMKVVDATLKKSRK